jgi:Kef-type K+ transport system membrane component KefB
MTLIATPCAIARTSLFRVAVLAGLTLCANVALAQSPARTAQPPAATASHATWDSLYRAHRMFELRDSLMAYRGPTSPDAVFFAGIVAHAFNDNDDAIAALAPLLDAAPRSLSQAHLIAATAALGDSYRRVFRYRASADLYRRMLRTRRPALDSAERALFDAWASVGDALAQVPPQRITWTTEAHSLAIANDSIPFAITASANGDTALSTFGLDPAAQLTTINATTAALRGVRELGPMVHLSIGGTERAGHVGVIHTLTVGSATIANVPVLIVPDDPLHPTPKAARTDGVLGLSALSALGNITFTRDGHVELSSPGADNDTTAVSNLLVADDAAVVNATYSSSRIPFVLDVTAPRTLLYPAFLQRFSSVANGASLTTYVGPSFGGDVAPLPAYLLPDLTLTVGTRAIRLSSINALMRTGDPRGAYYGGVLGQDALFTADRVTLDFGAMTVRLRQQPPAGVLPRIVYPTGTAGGTSPVSKVPEDIAFVILLFALFVVPKALQRYRLPSAITSLLMGAGATALGLFHNDPTLHLLSTFGIVALFLFAGLEIDGHELRRQARPLMLHGLVWSCVLAIGALVTAYVFGFALRPALLIALALLTPSTGFILSSLAGFGLHESERFTVKTYVIASELLALTVLFFVLQSTSAGRLAFAVAAMLGVVIIIPLAFKLFARLVAPHAPRSEFAFLLMVAIVCAYATRRLGVYYLVGAFLVGIAAQRFRSELPAMSSEKMVDALESFGSVFIPFYFFHAGTEIARDQITWRALAIGLALIVLLIPLRIAITVAQRRFALRDHAAAARRVGIALVPTLVFTLVLTDILNTDFGVAKYVLGALVLYTVINTSIPAFVLHSAPPEFENVEAADIDEAPR